MAARAHDIPEIVRNRLPVYLRVLRDRYEAQVRANPNTRWPGTITSAEIATEAGIGDSSTVRRDLSRLGTDDKPLARPRVGYRVADLLRRLEEVVPGATVTHEERAILLAGDGPLADAFIRGDSLLSRLGDWRVVAVCDVRRRKTEDRDGIRYLPLRALDVATVEDLGIEAAIVCGQPGTRYVRQLAKTGIRAVLSCLPREEITAVPEGLSLRRLAVEDLLIQALSDSAPAT